MVTKWRRLLPPRGYVIEVNDQRQSQYCGCITTSQNYSTRPGYWYAAAVVAVAVAVAAHSILHLSRAAAGGSIRRVAI